MTPAIDPKHVKQSSISNGHVGSAWPSSVNCWRGGSTSHLWRGGAISTTDAKISIATMNVTRLLPSKEARIPLSGSLTVERNRDCRNDMPSRRRASASIPRSSKGASRSGSHHGSHRSSDDEEQVDPQRKQKDEEEREKLSKNPTWA